MYISTISITGNNNYEMHRDIYGAFPSNGAGRVLYRVYEDTIIIYSEKEPNWNNSRLKDLPIYVIKSAEYKKDENLKFNLLVSPSVKRFGKRHAIIDESELVNWLVRKSNQHGFKLINLKIFPNKILTLKKDVQMYFNSVMFIGEFTVIDADLFNMSLQNGIGSGKSFGFGLLHVEKNIL